MGLNMGFWDRVNDEMKKAAVEGWEAFKESARVGMLRYQTYLLHKKADRLFARIGGLTYEMSKTPDSNPLKKPEILSIVAEIAGIETEAAGLDAEIKKAKQAQKED